MSEQEIREGMLLAVWDEPPLDFDPDALIRRAEQKKSRRRALASVGVATALIVVSAFALPSLLQRDSNGDQMASEQTQSTGQPSAESESARLERIGNQLAEKLALTMPTLKKVSGNLRPGGTRRSFESYPSSTSPSQPPGPDLSGFVFLTDDIGPTSLQVVGGKNMSAKDLCIGASNCKTLPVSDGSEVTEAEFVEGASITRSVAHRQFKSGFAVQISSYSHNPATGSGLRQTVPVPVDVLTSLVTEVRVKWE